MTKAVVSCKRDETLKTAADLMQMKSCGALPVVDDKDRPVGMITDRDICLAAAKFGGTLSDLKLEQAMSRKTAVCDRSDDIETALKKMKKRRIRRLPVIGKEDKLAGIISIADFFNIKKMDKKLTKKIFAAMSSISRAGPIVLREIEE